MIKSKSIKTILFSIISLFIFISIFYFVMNLSKPVTLVVDGVEIKAYTTKNTVEDVLSENNIVLQDGGILSPSKLSKVDRGERIILDNPVPVVLYLGNNDPYEVMTTKKTIGELLKEQEIILDDNDIVTPSVSSEIIPDEEIFIILIDVKVNEEVIDIPYNTEVKYNNSLYEDEQNVVREGKNGLRTVKTEKYYENGIEKSSNVIYDNITEEPISKIVEKGTKKRVVEVPTNISNAEISGDKITFLGKEYKVSSTKRVEATAFYNSGSNGNHITATGNPTVYNPSGWSTIAVDPRVIPLNTRVYIEGYGFGIAHDTGGAIKGNIIDVFMPSRDAAYTWGRKKGVKIYILE